jgi:alkaline phosphatase
MASPAARPLSRFASAALPLACVAALLATLLAAPLAGCAGPSRTARPAPDRAASEPPTSVIFLHPDGSGANMWSAARMLHVGPDADLQWDLLPHIGLYRGHLTDSLAASSNAGGTIHAYGVKVGEESFGNDNGAPIARNAAGAPARSVAVEALARGRAVGIVSTASVTDAGTGTFLASVASRRDHEAIAAQMMDARPQVLLGGGEKYFLPVGVRGRHGEGARRDGRNLVAEAQAQGYTVVFTRDELRAVPRTARRVLGLFAEEDTFIELTEEEQRARGTPDYHPQSPTYAEMVQAALTALALHEQGFLLVAEEEATDNFPGSNNARATFEAVRRADEAIGVARRFIASDPRTLLMVAADSDCGGMQVWSSSDMDGTTPLPPRDENGAPLDGRDGTGTPAFLAAPDARGRRLPFGIVWASEGDVAGAVLVRGDGWRAGELITPTMDNTRIAAAIRAALYGE